MKYGYCTGFSTNPNFQLGENLLEMISSCGFDFVEFPLMNFEAMTDEEFSELENHVASLKLNGPTACNFFPGRVKLVGKEVNKKAITDYLDIVLSRCKKLGINCLILGSGPARTFGTDQTRDEAFNQFASLLKEVILPKTKDYGMLVCIEPFERTYCNLIVSVLEGLELLKAVNDVGLLLMVDLYHMQSNCEPLDCLDECFPFIRHIHVAGAGRRVPTDADEYVFAALRKMGRLGYEGSVSFETSLPQNDAELIKVLQKVKINLENK